MVKSITTNELVTLSVPFRALSSIAETKDLIYGVFRIYSLQVKFHFF